eukprot:jgi/Botrbrau1/15430/Bobra.43_2s0056.2
MIAGFQGRGSDSNVRVPFPSLGDLPPSSAPNTSADFWISERGTQSQNQDIETDLVKLAWRQKQIDYGKNTLGYQLYIQTVPRSKRRSLHDGLVPIDPMTPDIRRSCSKRAFAGQVMKWRRMLHAWDPTIGDDSNSQIERGCPRERGGRNSARSDTTTLGSKRRNHSPDTESPRKRSKRAMDKVQPLQAVAGRVEDQEESTVSHQPRSSFKLPALKDVTDVYTNSVSDIGYDIFGAWDEDGQFHDNLTCTPYLKACSSVV